MLLVLAFILLLVLPTPWNVVAFLAALVAFLGELAFWNRTVRHRRVDAGSETLIGSKGVAISPLRPTGQVRVDGEIWDARCDEGADPGQTVTVVDRDRLTLVVAVE